MNQTYQNVVAETFKSLVGRYSDDTTLAEKLYSELAKLYSEKGRHYHNVGHLNFLLLQILPVSSELHDVDAVLFALYYHDAIYNVLRKDNEERSADLAGKRLSSLTFHPYRIENCKRHILATKRHQRSEDDDTNFFTDADLSILGQDWPTYKIYSENVRKEYFIYPDLIYLPGRKKVVRHFLDMERIFKTERFFEKFERQARSNLKREMDELTM